VFASATVSLGTIVVAAVLFVLERKKVAFGAVVAIVPRNPH
jgi:hypothetical protein